MTNLLRATALSSVLALGACANSEISRTEASAALFGATAAGITAAALNADPAWTVVAALSGAVAGSLIARHAEGDKCAYARGDGTYVVRPCP